jgi:hypothetical protein
VPAPRAGGDPAALAAGAGPVPERAGFGAHHEDDDDDYDDDFDERPRHPYTWLHLIVLALVAFVLGFLIVLLLSNNSKEDGAASTGAAPSVVAVVASASA